MYVDYYDYEDERECIFGYCCNYNCEAIEESFY